MSEGNVEATNLIMETIKTAGVKKAHVKTRQHISVNLNVRLLCQHGGLFGTPIGMQNFLLI